VAAAVALDRDGAETAGAGVLEGVLEGEGACPDPQPPARSTRPSPAPSTRRRELPVRRGAIAEGWLSVGARAIWR